MKHHTTHRRHLPKGQVVAGAAVVIGLAASTSLRSAAGAHAAARCLRSAWAMPAAAN